MYAWVVYVQYEFDGVANIEGVFTSEEKAYEGFCRIVSFVEHMEREQVERLINFEPFGAGSMRLVCQEETFYCVRLEADEILEK